MHPVVRTISRYHPRKSHENESYAQPIYISNCTKKALIGDTTSRSHCVDVFIVHRSIDWLGNMRVITQVFLYDNMLIN